jgi:hypothetical protein
VTRQKQCFCCNVFPMTLEACLQKLGRESTSHSSSPPPDPGSAAAALVAL